MQDNINLLTSQWIPVKGEPTALCTLTDILVGRKDYDFRVSYLNWLFECFTVNVLQAGLGHILCSSSDIEVITKDGIFNSEFILSGNNVLFPEMQDAFYTKNFMQAKIRNNPKVTQIKTLFLTIPGEANLQNSKITHENANVNKDLSEGEIALLFFGENMFATSSGGMPIAKYTSVDGLTTAFIKHKTHQAKMWPLNVDTNTIQSCKATDFWWYNDEFNINDITNICKNNNNDNDKLHSQLLFPLRSISYIQDGKRYIHSGAQAKKIISDNSDMLQKGCIFDIDKKYLTKLPYIVTKTEIKQTKTTKNNNVTITNGKSCKIDNSLLKNNFGQKRWEYNGVWSRQIFKKSATFSSVSTIFSSNMRKYYFLNEDKSEYYISANNITYNKVICKQFIHRNFLPAYNTPIKKESTDNTSDKGEDDLMLMTFKFMMDDNSIIDDENDMILLSDQIDEKSQKYKILSSIKDKCANTISKILSHKVLNKEQLELLRKFNQCGLISAKEKDNDVVNMIEKLYHFYIDCDKIYDLNNGMKNQSPSTIFEHALTIRENKENREDILTRNITQWRVKCVEDILKTYINNPLIESLLKLKSEYKVNDIKKKGEITMTRLLEETLSSVYQMIEEKNFFYINAFEQCDSISEPILSQNPYYVHILKSCDFNDEKENNIAKIKIKLLLAIAANYRLYQNNKGIQYDDLPYKMGEYFSSNLGLSKRIPYFFQELQSSHRVKDKADIILSFMKKNKGFLAKDKYSLTSIIVFSYLLLDKERKTCDTFASGFFNI